MTSKDDLICIILAAGKGKRMQSDTPKVLHSLAGRAILDHVLLKASRMSPKEIIVVTSPENDLIEAHVGEKATCVKQPEQNGTGGAVQAAFTKIPDNFDGKILILNGDVPLVAEDTLQSLTQSNADLTITTVNFEDPQGYGRVVLEYKSVVKIVEDKDCSAEEKTITTCNAGIYAGQAKSLKENLGKLKPTNAQGELYLTDLVEISNSKGLKVSYVSAEPYSVQGVNTRTHLSALEQTIQNRLRRMHLENGVTIIDPNTVYFSMDTKIGFDCVLEPNVFFGPGVTIGDKVTIKAFSHLEGANVHNNVVIGPFARLRPGAVLEDKTKIGNFVEVKNATIGKGSKANHLAYVGDAEIGEGSNISAGVITANYDGFKKSKTIIGDDVMVGTNSTLIAPLTIEDGAYIAAGSTISGDVPQDALAVSRNRSIIRDGWAKNFKEKNRKDS